MARCDICSKKTNFGNNRSHAENKTSRSWKPNIRKVSITKNGTHKSINVCTRCLRSNKVTRSV